jgi:hypothetical protein
MLPNNKRLIEHLISKQVNQRKTKHTRRRNKPGTINKGNRRKPTKRGGGQRNPLHGSKAVEHFDFLSLLSKTNKRHQAKLLEIANSGQMSALLECIENVGNRNVKNISLDNIRKFQRHSNMVQKLYRPRTSLQRRKQILADEGIKGGFLGALIPLAVSAISSLFGKR